MTIPLTNYDDIVRHFELLGLHKGQAIVVHSKLLSFGRINGGVESVFKALQQVVGDKGTLVFPTYTLNLSSEDVYNPDTTPSYGMGALSEYVRKIPGVLRSNCPMHNHCALGPLAEKVVTANPEQPLGPGSSFAVMRETGFYLLLLGCDFQEGATFVHHIESEVGVPYRSWLKLPRIRQDRSGRRIKMICQYYGHKNSGHYKNSLHNLQIEMEKSNVMNVIAAPLGRSFFMSLEDLYVSTSKMLKESPYALVTEYSIN